MSDTPAPARPSAAVMIARDGSAGLEILLLRRNEKVVFHGGAWVFPGGRVDDTDGGDDAEAVARQAAVRETREETGLEISAADLHWFAHWTTPVELPKRFSTWFFAARYGGNAAVKIDDSEIVDSQWLTPQAALAAHVSGELTLPGPTFVTLLGFADCADLASLNQTLAATDVQHFVPRLVPIEDGRCTLYAEDAGYETLEFDAPGARHRLIMRGTDWDYQRSF